MPTLKTGNQTGGTQPYSYLAAGAANQDSQVVKDEAGQLYGYSLFNTTSELRYVKLYNKTTAPTSADTPMLRYMQPVGGGGNIVFDDGVIFSTGLSFRITTGAADNDTGTVTANDVLVNFYYR